MINAKNEFLNEIKGKDLLCCEISTFKIKPGYISLSVGFSEQEFNRFVNSLDFEFDDMTGPNMIDGFIWYKNNTWSERRFLNGREWWNFLICVPIPEYLKLNLDI